MNGDMTDTRSRTELLGSDDYSYRLPYFVTSSRLLFQGDSITDMNRGRNQADRNHYLGHSYAYLIAARLSVDMPNARLHIVTRGISGNTVAGLRKRGQEDAVSCNRLARTLALRWCSSLASGTRTHRTKLASGSERQMGAGMRRCLRMSNNL